MRQRIRNGVAVSLLAAAAALPARAHADWKATLLTHLLPTIGRKAAGAAQKTAGAPAAPQAPKGRPIYRWTTTPHRDQGAMYGVPFHRIHRPHLNPVRRMKKQ